MLIKEIKSMLGKLLGHFISCLFLGSLFSLFVYGGLESGNLILLIMGGAGVLFSLYMFIGGVREIKNVEKK